MRLRFLYPYSYHWKDAKKHFCLQLSHWKYVEPHLILSELFVAHFQINFELNLGQVVQRHRVRQAQWFPTNTTRIPVFE